MSKKVTKTIKAGINTYTFEIEPFQDDIQNELYYIVTYQGTSFIMRYDTVEMRFIADRPAPYDAYVLEYELGSIIEGLED